MSKRPDDLARERKQLDAMAAGEARIHERLLTLRGELDVLATTIDKVIMPRRQRRRVGASAAADLRVLGSLVSFSRRKP